MCVFASAGCCFAFDNFKQQPAVLLLVRFEGKPSPHIDRIMKQTGMFAAYACMKQVYFYAEQRDRYWIISNVTPTWSNEWDLN